MILLGAGMIFLRRKTAVLRKKWGYFVNR